jgi:hypothetical protein
MIWLWRDTGDVVRMADHAEATFWFVLPSPPMLLIVPAAPRRHRLLDLARDRLRGDGAALLRDARDRAAPRHPPVAAQ